VLIEGDEVPAVRGEAPGANDLDGTEAYDEGDSVDEGDGDGVDEGDGDGVDDDDDQEDDDMNGEGDAIGNTEVHDEGDGVNSKQQQSNVSGGRKIPGRKPKGGEEDATNWCQDTHVTFLNTVVARNPFVKQGCKISEKWHDIALDMAQSTRHMKEFAVTARADALRIKFTRLKTQLKNFRQSGRCARQSGIASVRQKDENDAKLADIMDECLNLQRDVQDGKDCKKKAAEAAKQCKASSSRLICD
jgi:hypothetical protein